jgi:hypothetical protein
MNSARPIPCSRLIAALAAVSWALFLANFL